MKTLKILAVTGMVSVLAVFYSHGTPIGLEAGQPHYPDFTSVSYMTLSYTAGAAGNNFQALGYTDAYTQPNGTADSLFAGDYGSYTAWSFDVEANISSLGQLTNGTVTIAGDLGYGAGPETLLTGSLIPGTDGTTFGSAYFGPMPDATGDYFEFTFDVTGGNSSVMSDFGGLNAAGGIVISANFQNGDTIFDGTWGNSFSSSSGYATADAFAVVPEPSSILFVLVGGVLLLGGYRRCRRSN